MRVRGGSDWTLNLEMRDVGIDGDMMPFVASVYPLAATGAGQANGKIAGTFKLTGRGLTWDAIKPQLAGTGQISINSLQLPTSSVVAQLVSLAGGGSTALSFDNADAEFTIKGGWLNFSRLSASGRSDFNLTGKVSLDGKLALEYDLMPLVRKFGGGKTYREAAKYVDKLPVRIVGTVDQPKLKAPSIEDIAKGAINKGLGGILDRFRKKK
jgi:hypothetical protein